MEEENNNVNPANNQDTNLNNNVNNVEKPKYRTALIIITLIITLLSIYCKLQTMGWITVLLCWAPIIPAVYILFVVTGIVFANSKNKNSANYILFAISCITVFLFSFTFVDFGDIGPEASIIKAIDSNTLLEISFVSLVVNVVITIILLVKSLKKAKK